MSGPIPDPRQPQRAALRQAVLQLVIGVVALDITVMVLYQLLHVGSRPDREKMLFIAAWTVGTAAVVMVMLRRVRRARGR
ncbi:MAG: hypothetical protein H0W68_02220 [Gemmatimonadaceae bacterium]|nr:hypothetical protein [Gemmatimonadaceae bacterium]